MKNIVIVHYSPLELYPPLQNLIGFLKEYKKCKVAVFTTKLSDKVSITFNSPSSSISINRVLRSDTNRSKAIRYFCYFVFHIRCLINIIKLRPIRLFYFETLSSLAPFIYKAFFNRSVGLLIHYHEYISNIEYQKASPVLFYLHKLEKRIYNRSIWISHTNKFRLDMFREDISPIRLENLYVIPNYPPRTWKAFPKPILGMPIKVVYAGALSLTTMFTETFARWVVDQKGKVIWDIYSYNFTQDVDLFIKQLESPWVKLNPGVDYDELPSILIRYDVGIILYKGHIPNYIYNAPNKLFEYLACGLSVWLPSVMVGSLSYCTDETYPQVVALDFNGLDVFTPESALNASNFPLKSTDYFCDTALSPLLNVLLK